MADPGGLYWFSSHYCAACRRAHSTQTVLDCGSCGGTFGEFLDSGFLGCGSCYAIFGDSLRPLLEEYRGSSSSFLEAVGASDSLALARTREIQDALRPDASHQVAPAGPQPARTTAKALHLGIHEPRGGWLRVRAARNIAGIPFWNRLSGAQRNVLSWMLLSDRSAFARLDRGQATGLCSGQELQSLQAVGLVSAAVVALRVIDSGAYVCAGDEDHLRYVRFVAESPDAWAELERAAAEIALLDALYQYEAHPTWGFLCPCPANSGAGLRLSFEVVLPRLRASGEWPEFLASLRDAGFEVRGSGGEGTPVTDIVQLSNRGGFSGNLVTEARRMLVVVDRARKREGELA